MAEFDPVVQPINDPSYTRDSRGVDVPRTPGPEGVAPNQILPKGVEVSDRSAEYQGKAAAFAMEGSAAANKGFGDLFAGVVNIADFGIKAADALVKKDIERQVYDLANKEREEYTTRLESILQKAGGTKSLFGAEAGDGTEFSSRNRNEEVPGELEELPNTLNQLKAGLDAGKISNTYYTGRLLSHAKDLRARYPGYREYIDQQFAQVTGMNPANARVTALTQDINRAQTSQQASQKRAASEVWKRSGYASEYNGQIVNSTQALQKVRTGEWNEIDVANWAYKGDKQDADVKQKLQIDKSNANDRELDEKDAKAASLSIISARTENLVNNLFSNVGVNNLNELRQKMNQDMPQKWWQERVNELEGARDSFRADVRRQLQQGGRNSLATRMGIKPAEINDWINANIVEFDSLITSVKDKDANGIWGAANRIKSKTVEGIDTILKDPDLAPFALSGSIAKELFGDNTSMTKEFNQRLMDKQYHGKPAAVFNALETWLRTGAVMPHDVKKTENSTNPSFDEAFKKARAGEVLTKDAASKLVNIVGDIAKPGVSDVEKTGIAHSAYGPGNRKFLGKLDDPWGTFNKWYTDDITKEMRRLSASDFRMWNNYVNSMGESAQELLGKDFRDLSKMQDEKNIKLLWKTSDNGVRSIEVVPNLTAEQRRLMGSQETPRFRQVQQIVNRMNQFLYPLSGVAKHDNQIDVDAYMLRALRRQGFGPNPESGLMGQIIQGIITSRTPPEPTR